MYREIYTHETLTALPGKREQRAQELQRLVGMTPVFQRSLLRRPARWLGRLLLHLGTRLMVYGARRPDARTGADLRYS